MSLQILETDKDPDNKLSEASAEFRKTCGDWSIVPASYTLKGVKKDDNSPQKTGITTETWRGSYETKAVAIKMFKEHKDHDKTKAVRQAVPK